MLFWYLLCNCTTSFTKNNRRPNSGRNPEKILKSFLPCYSQSPLHLCLVYFFKLTQPLTNSSVRCCTLLNKKDENLIENKTPFPMLKEIHTGNLKFENYQDYGQRPQRNCTFMNYASGSKCCAICLQ